MKPLYWHPQSRRDADEAAAWRAEQDGVNLELAFIDTLETATRQLARRPGVGSARYADSLKIAGLRCWSLKKFPYLVFYMELERQVDIWRVLHEKRDIPVWMGEGA